MYESFYDWYKDGFTSIPNYLFNHYHEFDISSDEMVILLYILSQISQGNRVEDIQRISQHLGWSDHLVLETINQLVQKDYMEIELVENDYGKKTDHYTIRPLFAKLEVTRTAEISADTQSNTNEKSLYQIFELEFGRPLSPIEIEYLQNWLVKDGYDEDLIIVALRQAVLNRAYNLKYIDRILLNWSKKNILTAQEAEREIEQFERNRTQTTDVSQQSKQYEHIQIPMDYWNSSSSS